MAETVIKLQLNQQQLELMDRTIARGVAPDRAALVRLALREYAAARRAETMAKPNDLEPLR
jgi:Arc/MetJ-type ribon-helix-helix transcriptional regulator